MGKLLPDSAGNISALPENAAVNELESFQNHAAECNFHINTFQI